MRLGKSVATRRERRVLMRTHLSNLAEGFPGAVDPAKGTVGEAKANTVCQHTSIRSRDGGDAVAREVNRNVLKDGKRVTFQLEPTRVEPLCHQCRVAHE